MSKVFVKLKRPVGPIPDFPLVSYMSSAEAKRICKGNKDAEIVSVPWMEKHLGRLRDILDLLVYGAWAGRPTEKDLALIGRCCVAIARTEDWLKEARQEQEDGA